jgi:hypothetical protein
VEERLAAADCDVSLGDILGMDDEAEVTRRVTEAEAQDGTREPEAAPDTPEDPDVAEAALPAVDETVWSTAVEEEEKVPLPEFTTDELMEQLDIRNFGMLVSLNTQRWHAKTRDHKAAADAANASGADARAFEARKRLLVGADEKLRAVHTAIDAARTDHYRMTLPWSTIGVNDHGKRAGPRLLPNTLFFDYTKKMGAHKIAMTTSLDEFVQAYPTLIAVAQQKLGSSFNVADYPAPSQIAQHFDLSFDFLPIPKGADFGSVELHQAEKLSAALNRKTRQMLENAMQDAWKRLRDDVTHAHAALSNPESKFHYTLVDKMREHASMLTHLNVTKDPRIESIRDEIERGLCRWDIKEIRKDDSLRRRMAESAKTVLDTMQEVTNERSS